MLTAVRNFFHTDPVTSNIPDRAIFDAELERTRYTPDIAKLEEYEWQLVFVCDELKRDHLKHDLLGAESGWQSPAFTQQNFHYWQHDAPFLPAIPMRPTTEVPTLPFWPPMAKIKGELYLIRPQRFLELDTYRQNTVEFQRERVRLLVPFRKVYWLKDHNLDPSFGVQETFCRSQYTGRSINTSREAVVIIRAWMYIGRPAFYDPLISAYDYRSVEVFKSKNRRWCEQYYNIRRPPLAAK